MFKNDFYQNNGGSNKGIEKPPLQRLPSKNTELLPLKQEKTIWISPNSRSTISKFLEYGGV